jgi:hypothetical protein
LVRRQVGVDVVGEGGEDQADERQQRQPDQRRAGDGDGPGHAQPVDLHLDDRPQAVGEQQRQ